MLVLKVQKAMAAQAQTKQNAGEDIDAIQVSIDAEVEKRTKDLPVQNTIFACVDQKSAQTDQRRGPS